MVGIEYPLFYIVLRCKRGSILFAILAVHQRNNFNKTNILTFSAMM